MSDIAIFELLAAICALVAGVFIFDQHLHRPRPYKLMWSLGLFFYGIAAAAAFAGAADHWTVLDYKLWYYFGGIMTAAFLGLGSCYLLAPRRVAHGFAAVMIVLAVYAAVRIAFYTVPPEVAAQIASAPFNDVTNVSKLPVFPGDLTVRRRHHECHWRALALRRRALERLDVLAQAYARLSRRLDGAAGAGRAFPQHPDGPATARL